MVYFFLFFLLGSNKNVILLGFEYVCRSFLIVTSWVTLLEKIKVFAIKAHVSVVEDEYICIDPVKNRMAYAASFPISTGAISGPPFSMPTDSWFDCADGGFDMAHLNL